MKENSGEWPFLDAKQDICYKSSVVFVMMTCHKNNSKMYCKYDKMEYTR